MDVEVLAGVTNSVVVKSTGRRFPGVIIQGDTLNGWYVLAEHINALAKDTQSEELKDLARELPELLAGHLKVYEAVLREHGLDLPYHRTWKIGQFPSRK